MNEGYELELPDYFDKYSLEIESKGFFADAQLLVGGSRYQLTIFDPVRLTQEIADKLATNAAFSECNLVVVRAVTRDEIQKAVAELAETGFESICEPAAPKP